MDARGWGWRAGTWLPGLRGVGSQTFCLWPQVVHRLSNAHADSKSRGRFSGTLSAAQDCSFKPHHAHVMDQRDESRAGIPARRTAMASIDIAMIAATIQTQSSAVGKAN